MKRMNTLYIIALVCVGIGSIGAIALTIVQSIGSTKDKNEIISTTKSENLILKNSLDDLKRERDDLNKTLLVRDSKIQEQGENIIKLNEKLAEKSDYIQNYLTGGNGYPFIKTTVMNNDGIESFIFVVQNNFEYPLYGVSCSIVDFNIIDKKKYTKPNTNEIFIKQHDLDSAILVNKHFSEIPPKLKEIVDKKFPVLERRLRVSLHSRNKSVIQKIAIVFVDHEVHLGWQILDMDYKVLKESYNGGLSKKAELELVKKLNSIPSKLSLVPE